MIIIQNLSVTVFDLALHCTFKMWEWSLGNLCIFCMFKCNLKFMQLQFYKYLYKNFCRLKIIFKLASSKTEINIYRNIKVFTSVRPVWSISNVHWIIHLISLLLFLSLMVIVQGNFHIIKLWKYMQSIVIKSE